MVAVLEPNGNTPRAEYVTTGQPYLQLNETSLPAHRSRLLKTYIAFSFLSVRLYEVGGLEELVKKGLRHSVVSGNDLEEWDYGF